MTSRKWWALVPMVLAVLTVGLDATILSVALPTLGARWMRRPASCSGSLPHTLVFAAALIPGGMLGDRYGRKKMLIVSLVLFGVASIACAFALGGGVHRGARAPWLGRRAHAPDGSWRPPSPIRRDRAAAGRRRDNGRGNAWLPPRTAARRLDADQVRLELGLPHQPACRRAGRHRGRRSCCPRAEAASVSGSTSSVLPSLAAGSRS